MCVRQEGGLRRTPTEARPAEVDCRRGPRRRVWLLISNVRVAFDGGEIGRVQGDSRRKIQRIQRTNRCHRARRSRVRIEVGYSTCGHHDRQPLHGDEERGVFTVWQDSSETAPPKTLLAAAPLENLASETVSDSRFGLGPKARM